MEYDTLHVILALLSGALLGSFLTFILIVLVAWKSNKWPE